jgi:hypothetical protein
MELIYIFNQKDDGFLQSFVEIVGNRWPSLASLLSLSPGDIEQIKRDTDRVSGSSQASLASCIILC